MLFRSISYTLYVSLYSYLIRSLSILSTPKNIKDIDDYMKLLAEKGHGNDAMYALSQVSKGILITPLLVHYNKITFESNRVGGYHTKSELDYSVSHIHDNGGFQYFISRVEIVRNNGPLDPVKIQSKQVNNYCAIFKK